MAKDENKNNDKKPKQGQSFKSISELLKLDGASDVGFDAEQAEKDLQKLEERKKTLEEFKTKLKDYEKLNNNDYKLTVLKQLVERGLMILQNMEAEIADNPRGRDVECVATLMNSINAVIDSINKMDFFKEEIALKQENLNIKKMNSSSNTGTNLTQNNIYLTHSEFLDMIKNQQNSNNTEKTIDAEIINTEEK